MDPVSTTRAHRFGGVPYFGFEYITLVPIQTKMIDASLMSDAEVAWLDTYHAKVCTRACQARAMGCAVLLCAGDHVVACGVCHASVDAPGRCWLKGWRVCLAIGACKKCCVLTWPTGWPVPEV